MTSLLRLSTCVFVAALFAVAQPARAQLTNGNIFGVITDEQGGSIPGVVVEAAHTEAGFVRTATTDGRGAYRLAGLPIGTYRVTTVLPGFNATESIVQVNVATNVPLDIRLQIANLNETVSVSALAPRPSGREEVVDLLRVESLPLNGRQLADVAATLPAVGLGAHSDPSKTAQHTAQVSGANGRNLNTLVDGGDNNDDTVGGLLQAFPLESVEQFSLLSQRFDAEYGRAGAVMNIVTKSGTNTVRGSWFTLLRNDALNARTFTEKLKSKEKQPYERYQYGGSLGGPLVQNRAHFFAAYERTHQSTKQVVDTDNLLPGDGIYDVPLRQDLFSAKLTASLAPDQYLAVRYARDHNRQTSGAAPNAAFSTWATSTNVYDSLNVNHSWNVSGTALNELVFQFSNYSNDTPSETLGPVITLASGARAGANPSAPQTTEQRRWQFRNDYSWSLGRLGLAHQFRSGVNIVHTPRLFVSNEGGTGGFMQLAGNDLTSGVTSILLIGGTVSSNIPLNLYGVYLQDDWRATDRLTLNLGVRWDYLDGLPIEQTSTNFQNMQAAGLTGRFDGTFLQDFGKSPRGDWDNIQPRLGAVYDLRGDGRDLIRGGWGIYTDMAYTNANVLTTSLEGGGIVLSAACLPTMAGAFPWCGPQGFLKTDGGLFQVTDPISSIGLPLMTPTTGEVVSPRLEQPYTYQSNLGWTHEVNGSTSFSVDYVRVDGRDLNQRIRPNVDTDPGTAVLRYLAGVGVSPNSSSFRTAVSDGRSRYDALIFASRRRMSDGFDLNASYTLAKATSTVGTAYDELTQNLLQNVNDPFGDFQNGPSTRTDARHRVSVSAIVHAPYGVNVASIFSYHSALPVTTLEGIDLNGDLSGNDHTPMAYRFTGLNDDGTHTFEEAGPCETVNCSRRAPFSQLDLRISRAFPLFGHARIEAIAEVFNVFNAKNPVIGLSTTRMGIIPPDPDPQQLPTFMEPTAFAGDAGQREQRVGQLGFRLTF